MPYLDKINKTGSTYDIRDSAAVRFDEAQTLTTAQKQQALENVGFDDALGAAAVRYDESQNLSAVQKVQAQNNLGIATQLTAAMGAIRFDAQQTLTDAQKTQARGNIGAVGEGDTGEIKGAINDILNVRDISVNYILELGGINGSGSEFGATEGTYMRFADYYPTEAGSNLVPNHIQTSNEYMYVCYYNSSKVFQVREVLETGDTINTNYAYFRLSYYLRGGNNEATYRSWIAWGTINGNRTRFEQVETRVNGLANSLRKFKGLCFANISLPYEYNNNVAGLKAKIDAWNGYGFDGYIVCLNAVWSSGTLSLLEDMSALDEAFDYIGETGRQIKAFKLHCTTYDGSEAFKTAYYNLVSSLCTTIKGYGCYKFIVLNECTLCLDSTYADWIKSVLDMIGENGMGRSISYDLEKFGYGKVPATVVTAMTWFCFNAYPAIGNNRQATSQHDYQIAWDASIVIPSIQTYKNVVSAVKEMWITETGVNDYYENLAAPAMYNMNTSGATASNGKTQATYLQTALDTLNGNVDVVAPWYSIDYDPVKDVIQKELGVVE